MCDYSLMSVPNRLAKEGEELVAHRFVTGTMGLASASDLRPTAKARTFWSVLKEASSPSSPKPVAAVCIPPGARLRLNDIPERQQRKIGVGPAEEVTFTQITAASHSYRDAVRFRNGREIRLQELNEGQRVLVLDLSLAEASDLTEEMVIRERHQPVI